MNNVNEITGMSRLNFDSCYQREIFAGQSDY